MSLDRLSAIAIDTLAWIGLIATAVVVTWALRNIHGRVK